MEFHLTQLSQWEEVVQSILPHLQHPLLLLKGNLGAGKTTFTSELVRQLGSQDAVSSPTYALINTYYGKELKIYHFDLYRLNSPSEALDLGIDEYLEETGTFCIIEWPEIYEQELVQYPHHQISITNEVDYRHVIFN